MSFILTEPKTTIGRWLRVATPAQREELAQMAGTTEGYLYQLGGAHRKNPNLRLALNIHNASKDMLDRHGWPLFVLEMEDLVAVDPVSEDGRD